MVSFNGNFDDFIDENLEGLVLLDSLGSNNGKVLDFDECITLESTDGKAMSTNLGDVYEITLGLDVGTELGALDGYFDGYNDGKLEGSFPGDPM